jgi:tetratricopeptide (TPR) repeat protein
MPAARLACPPVAPRSACAADVELLAQALDEAIAHHRAGALSQARALYAAILEVDPRHPDALHLSGVIAHQHGAHDLARTLIGRALEVAPQSAEAHNSMGAACRGAGDLAAAEACFRHALGLHPEYPEAWQNLGMLHERRGDASAAIDCYQRALQHGGRNAGLNTMLGLALCADDRAAGALEAFQRALRASPDHVGALLGAGEALCTLGRLPEAIEVFRRVTALQPGSSASWLGLGVALLESIEPQDAIACFDRALALDPHDAQAHWNRALACLVGGDLERGWRDFGWRWRSRGWDSATRQFGCPRWGGEALDGLGILLWREQGLGEEILFSSMLPDIARRAAHCVLECDPRLVGLMRRSFPEVNVVAAGYPPHPATAARTLACHAPLGDLAPVLRASLASFPTGPAYLRADPQRVAHWRRRLASLGSGPWVGLCWRSSNRRGPRALACTDIEQWAPVLSRGGACFVNLQYDDCAQELARASGFAATRLASFPELDMYADLDETAALISALDLVLSAPTSVSILAGALGTPTWQLTCGADWHALGQAQSPWLPSLRRFYRRWDQGWDEVLAQLARALATWMKEYPCIDRCSRRFSH